MLLCKNRTHNNGELTIANVNEVVELKGWCAKKRNLGSLVFIDIRDKYGITQLRCDESVAEITSQIKTEYVIYAKGIVVERESKNKNIPTGEIEIDVKEISPKSMESKLIPGLFFAGEVIDVDAYTGGFNLQIAFSTAFLAGKSAAE